MKTITTVKVTAYFERDERFVVPGKTSYSGTRTDIQVSSLVWSPDSPEEVRVDGFKVRKDGQVGSSYARDVPAAFLDLPFNVRQDLVSGSVEDMGYILSPGPRDPQEG